MHASFKTFVPLVQNYGEGSAVEEITLDLPRVSIVLNLDIIFSVAEDTEVAVVVEVDIAVDRLRHTTGAVDIHVRDLALTLHAVSTITGQIATRLRTYSYHKCK